MSPIAARTVTPGRRVDPGASSTAPTHSIPRTRGKRTASPDPPARVTSSERLSPNARTRTRTQPGRPAGAGRSSSRRTSGAPGWWTTTALISAPPSRGPPLPRGRGRDDRLRPVDHRGGLDHMLAEAERLRVQPEGEPDELGQVQDREIEVAADGPLGQRLLKVQVEVTQGTRRDEAVGLGVHRVADVRPGLAQRGFLVHGDDREAAALVHAGVVDHRAAEGVDDLMEVGVARVVAVDAEAVARPDDVAAVERPDAQVAQRALDARAQLVEADLLDQDPEQVLVLDALLVAQALAVQVAVDQLAVLARGVQALLALALRPLAGRADVHHHRAVGLLGQREGAGVERVGELLVVLGDHARAAARRAVEPDELEVQQRGDLGHRAVQLGGEAARDAARPVGDPHALEPSIPAVLADESSVSVPPGSPWAASCSSSSPMMYRLNSRRSGRSSTLSKYWRIPLYSFLWGCRSAFCGVTLRCSSAGTMAGSELSSSGTARGWNLPP